MNLQYLVIVLSIISAAFNVVYAANSGLPTTTSVPPWSTAFKIVTVQKISNCKQLTSTDDKIQIHYRAVNLKNGREFDNSYYNNIPVKVHLGMMQFMKGWDIGLTGVCGGYIYIFFFPLEFPSFFPRRFLKRANSPRLYEPCKSQRMQV